MSMISTKTPPTNLSSDNGGKVIASTISISFQKNEAVDGDSSSISVTKIKVQSLIDPIKLQMSYNASNVEEGRK